ncbi:hypothetical protein Tco_1328922 [Tanacetum coccineum]
MQYVNMKPGSSVGRTFCCIIPVFTNLNPYSSGQDREETLGEWDDKSGNGTYSGKSSGQDWEETLGEWDDKFGDVPPDVASSSEQLAPECMIVGYVVTSYPYQSSRFLLLPDAYVALL